MSFLVDQITSCASKYVCFIVHGFNTCMRVCQHYSLHIEFEIPNRKHMQKGNLVYARQSIFVLFVLFFFQNYGTCKILNTVLMVMDNNLSF